MELKQKVEQALSQVIDPETGLDVMRMQLVKNLNVTDDGTVSLTFIPSSPVCPLGIQLGIAIQEALKKVSGIKKIDIDVQNYLRAGELKQILADNA